MNCGCNVLESTGDSTLHVGDTLLEVAKEKITFLSFEFQMVARHHGESFRKLDTEGSS
jgi:hypothetical protein